MKRPLFCTTVAGLLACGLLAGALPATAISAGRADRAGPPATSAPTDRADRAAMQTMRIPSHGALMNALVYVAAGAGPHPAVVLLHGFPGNERNLDLAQDMRRTGWDVLYFNYRGSWGTPGDFSFVHSIEDTAAAIAYLRQPEVAKSLRLDPARIVLIGHSMGGFMAIAASAADPRIKAFVTISAADMAGRAGAVVRKEGEAAGIAVIAKGLAGDGMAPLSGCTPDGLAHELVAHAADWRFLSKVDALKDRTALVVASNDGLAPANDTFVAALHHAGDSHVASLHLPTDHSYSDQRVELSKAVLAWLATLPK
jgi:pimeloyl-ACP methyl ester carboxylesterase